MKKVKWYEVLFVVLLTALTVFALMSCEKEQDKYVSPPEHYLTVDKTVKFSGEKKVGSEIKFWVQMPEPFTQNLQWYFDYGNATMWKAGTDTICHTYKTAGVYYVRVVGWNANHTKAGFSDAAKLQILD